MAEEKEKLFNELNAESGNDVVEMESICVACEENGKTSILLTKIPHFRDVAIMAFACPHCGYKNSEVQNTAEAANKGIKFKLSVEGVKDLNRQVVKGNYCTILVPELELEIPKITQAGTVNTVEGILTLLIDSLEVTQYQRREHQPEAAKKIDAFIEIIKEYTKGLTPFTFIVDDPAGDSFVENYLAPGPDPQLEETHYERTEEMNRDLGFATEEKASEEPEKQTLENQKGPAPMAVVKGDVGDALSKLGSMGGTDIEVPKEVMVLPSTCHLCYEPCECKMFVTDIPYFKEVVLMAVTCDKCGYKSCEVKPGGAIPEKGRRISVKISAIDDLNRDILKSETAMIQIPEVSLELQAGTLGGRFTTVEGLVLAIRDQLKSSNPFATGDAADQQQKIKFEAFLERLDSLAKLKETWTLIIDDAVGNSYVQNLCAPDDDPQMKITDYTRTKEQDDDLGISDMKVD